MQKYQGHTATVKNYRLTDGDSWREESVPQPSPKMTAAEHNAFPQGRWTPHRCCAYREDGTICNELAGFLDLQRGGFVCAEHKPKGGAS